MRRAKQQLSVEETDSILKQAASGVLSLCGKEMKPYGVPLSFVYEEGKIYFHCALEGYKLDLIKENPKASFTVIWRDEILPEKFTTKFQSVIAQGTLHLAEEEELIKGICLLGEKYSPGLDPKPEIERFKNRFLVPVLVIEECTGKQGIEYLI